MKQLSLRHFRYSRSTAWAVWMIAAFLGLHAIGCGGPEGKYEVSGTVMWNGQPIETGFVFFKPLEGNFAAEAGAIENGQFKFYARPGMNRVEITGTKKMGFDQAMNQYEFAQFIPAKFNNDSTLVEKVNPNENNRFEFSLTDQ